MASSTVSAADDWRGRVNGDACPLDAPRPSSNDHWDLIAPLAVSSLYLSANQTYRGQCQLIFDPRHVARIDQLTPDEWSRLAEDLFRAHQAVMDVTKPDHINVESLGNVVPHLHWHIIPRYRNDPRWGAPIWQTPLDTMPDTRLASDDRASLIDAIRQALAVRQPAPARIRTLSVQQDDEERDERDEERGAAGGKREHQRHAGQGSSGGDE